MPPRQLTITQDRLGYSLHDDGQLIAWYPSCPPAVDMARTLAEAALLRGDRGIRLTLLRPGQPAQPLPLERPAGG
jgi:hypothetical protein